ncbi:hypothetical protein TSAR_005078 [Trichomalopsis sarcophagae]|uniref:U5 small nuclear ribonucleoprotein TSSC4 n=1 Tax=Trichomalopsis sarcophagae TaxID=543379 RepID=A0A232EVK8_9HYME|nr:hypothetical protein TSAR_005078 [Trichomalopsis sarcophagae]
MDPDRGSCCLSFIDRQKQLNQQLLKIERDLNKHNNHRDSNVPKLEDLCTISRNRNKIKGFRGRQSIFKRPEGPAPKTNLRPIADYRRNPTKWTYYNLDNVSDISDESNREAAFAFLNDLRERREAESRKQNKIKEKLKHQQAIMDVETNEVNSQEDDEMETEERFNVDDSGKGSISFKKPQKKAEPIEQAKPEFRGNKVVMPEYTFGTRKVQKKKNPTQRNKSEKIDKNKEMRLDHLQIEEEEEED